jgi:HlyD family secretion protein
MVGVCAAAGLTVYSQGWPRAGVRAQVQPGDTLPIAALPRNGASTAVVALGHLEPDGGVLNLGVPLADRLDRLLVKEGDQVTKGQPLAYLESRADRQADLDLINAQLKEADARFASITSAGQAQIAEAKLHVRQVDELDPLELKAQQAKVRLLEAQLAAARADLKRFQSLETASVPKQQMELQQLAAHKAEEELAGARALYDKLRAGQELNRLAAAAALATAEANLIRYQSEIPRESLAITKAQAELRLARTVITAPCSGTVLKILTQPGEAVGARAILQMGDVAHMVAIAEVYETEVKRIHAGDQATITSRALPGPLTGTVSRVGRMIARNQLLDVDPTAAADHRVVEVEVRLEAAESAAAFIHLQVQVSIAPATP